jgi:hypothetical protein
LLADFCIAGDVKIGLFTSAYRKCGEAWFGQVLPGTVLKFDLAGNLGKKKGNGLYYLTAVWTPPEGSGYPVKKQIEKLLIMR